VEHEIVKLGDTVGNKVAGTKPIVLPMDDDLIKLINDKGTEITLAQQQKTGTLQKKLNIVAGENANLRLTMEEIDDAVMDTTLKLAAQTGAMRKTH